MVGSVTTMSSPSEAGWDDVSEIVPTDTSYGAITNGAGFDSLAGFPGFCICTMEVTGVCTSDEFRAVVQTVTLEHAVARGVPFSKITEAPGPLPATKFRPFTSSGKLSTAPAITLEGNSASIIGPSAIATIAVADLLGSASLVAITAMAFGEGAADGAVYKPLASTEPHAVPAHPWPVTPLCTVQVTPVLALFATVAVNCRVLAVAPDGETNAYAGDYTLSLHDALPI